MQSFQNRSRRAQWRTLFAVLLPLVLNGCAAAVVGGGAAGGIAYTDRGAKGDIKGSVSEVNQQARAALQDMKIQVTGDSSEQSGRERELKGKAGETDVTVKMTEAAQGTTHVEVIARESMIKWNKDFARDILAQIVNKR